MSRLRSSADRASSEPRSERPIRRRQYTDEWVGLLVLVTIAVFFAAAVEAGLLHQWLQPPGRLRILLPQTGVGGLSPGADVEVVGIHAGTVRSLRLNTDGAMYAVADIDPQAEPFIRRDSRATISLRYAVAGAAYVSLSRGSGEPMDWDYAVVTATTAHNPVDLLTETIRDIQTRVTPILANAEDVTGSAEVDFGRHPSGERKCGSAPDRRYDDPERRTDARDTAGHHRKVAADREQGVHGRHTCRCAYR